MILLHCLNIIDIPLMYYTYTLDVRSTLVHAIIIN